MIWALLVALGVPLWMVAGGLCAALISRRRVMRLPGTFTCKARMSPEGSWPRARQQARWVHDVLLIHRGIALARFDALAVEAIGATLERPDVKGLGDEPTAVRLHVEGGAIWEVASADPVPLPSPGSRADALGTSNGSS